MNEPECAKPECTKKECEGHCDCHEHKAAGSSGGTSGHSGGKEEFHGLKIYPGQVIKWKGKKPLPNDRCHCGSGKKFKKCCGR